MAFHASMGIALALALWALWRGPRWFRSGGRGWRFDVLSLGPLRRLVRRRPFQFGLQLPLVLLLLLILSAGFLGSPVAERNLATVLTWTIWWTLLIVDIVLLGRMWCLVCPWEALASWIRRLSFWRRRPLEPLALELPWPRWLRNVYPATVLFVGLTWLELGFGVTRSPRATAILGLLMVLLAVIPALLFERRSFCRYGCLIGRICGLYSMLAPVEVRAREPEICRGCTTQECFRGNGAGYPCPTGQYLPTMRTNAYCTVCTECVKSCPHDNVAINVRGWAADLHAPGPARRDEAILAVVLLSLTSFHGLTMTPAWGEALAWLRGATGLRYLAVFSLGMATILVLPALTYLLFSRFAARFLPAVGRRGARSAAAIRYAYPLIAIALTYHLAHNAGHFLAEAGQLLPVLSDPFGTGRDLLGTAAWHPGPLVGPSWIWATQILLVLLGLCWALRAAERAHRRLEGTGAGLLAPRVAIAGFLLLATLANLWLLAQPMEMRTGL
ncbi:MAG: hypothetical protein PVF68_10730 [Acidobacteriota bacterium]